MREQRAIEVGRERGDLTGEVGWEVQPCVDSTYVRGDVGDLLIAQLPLNDGIAPEPFVTRLTASARSGCAS